MTGSITEVGDLISAALSSGGRITFPPGLGEPASMVTLVERLPNRHDVELLIPFRVSPRRLHPPSRVTVRAHFGGGSEQVVRSQYIAARYGRLMKAMRPGGPLAVDVAVIRVSPPDSNGRHSVGPSATMTAPLAGCARLVIGEVDADLPRTRGPGAFVTRDEIDVLLDPTEPPYMPEPKHEDLPSGPTSAIASFIDSLVPDEVTVQVGLGRNAQAVTSALRGRSRLGLVAGLMSADLAELVQSGEVDSSQPVSAGEAIGPAELMDYVSDNPHLIFRTSEEIHHPGWLARHKRLVTINSVLTLDLLGRANTEFVGDRVVGGLGGLPDFLEGGSLSPSGFNILVVPTDSATGRVRLVRRLASSDISVLAHHVDYVITEFGIADLRSATDGETRERLLAVADPESARVLEHPD